MDLSKVFESYLGSVQVELLAKVGRLNLKVYLCSECTNWNAKMSQLFRQLKKIEMEMVSYLEPIHECLGRANEYDKKVGGGLRRREIGRQFRTEASQKCVSQLKGVHPKVKVQKLSADQLLTAKRKIRHNNRVISHKSPSSMELRYGDLKRELSDDEHVNIKMEQPDSDERNLADDNENEHDNTNHGFEGLIEGDMTTPVESTEAFPIPVELKPDMDKRTDSLNAAMPIPIKYSCKLCSKHFANEVSYKQHHRRSHSVNKFACNVCKKSFTRQESLNYHQRISCKGVQQPRLPILILPSFTCPTCGMGFRTKKRLRVHVTNIHLQRDEKKCRHCSKIFSTTNSLRRHEAEHLKGREYGCEVCGRRFQRKFNLTRHRLAKHDRVAK